MSKQKIAVITGSSSGIGLAIARQMAASGYGIMLHGLMSHEEGGALAKSLSDEFSVPVAFDDADLRDPAGAAALIEKAQATLGSVDVLVNNAGIQYTASIGDFPVQKWHDIIAINLSSVFFTTQAALPGMQKSGWGRVINIASVHGLVASVEKAAYCAAKHGVVGLTKVTALEEASKGITANIICPGWVETPLVKPQIEALAEADGITYDEAKRKLVTAKQPMPEMTDPAMIGDMVVFLCSDSAATISGASMPIDGGWTAQ